MKDLPLLSVIVPVYNVKAYLTKCVQSILSQTYENLEVILVDDGAQDGSGALCDDFADRDPRVRVLHQKNQGQAMARNHALDLSRGDYITFVDGDDWIEPEAYSLMMEALLKTDAGVACCGRFNVEETTGEKTLGLCPEKEEVLSTEEMLTRMFTWQGCDCSPCDKVFRASAFLNVRFPLKSGSEDIAILYKLVMAAGETVMVPKPLYNYLQRAGSTSYGVVNEKTFQYEQYTKELYGDICRILPAVREPAEFLYVRSLARTVLLLDQADGDTRKKYGDRLKQGRKGLRSHLRFLLTAPYFGKQERLTDLLMAFGLYRGLRKLRHRE